MDNMPQEPKITNTAIENVIQAYSRFVPCRLLQLMGKESVTDIALGDGIEKKMTILFSDIRDFTTISEAMTPRQNFSFLNSYFACMEPAITQHHGIVDKYIGDAIMALFPTNADDAVAGAIQMLRQLAEYNKQTLYLPIDIGIGLNTGFMMLGTVGANDRMDTTVISDAVNLASRLESMTKGYGAPLLISEHTYYNLENPSRYSIRFADRVKVKGKQQPQSVYEVFDADLPEVQAGKKKTIKLFEKAIAYYYFKKISQALELFQQCVEICPHDKPAQRYIERCQNMLNTGMYDGTGEVDLSIVWTPDLTIGVPIIDTQHQELFRYINEFVESIRNCHDSSQTKSLLEFLGQYTYTHFQTEEKCMEQHGYPFLDVQKQQHERFIQYFSKLKAEMAENIDDQYFFLFKIQVFVMDWVVHHTAKLDVHFGKFISMRK